MVHERLMTMARFFAVRKRNAIRKFGDMGEASEEGLALRQHFDAHAVTIPITLRLIDDHVLAFRDAFQDLCFG